MADSEGRKVSFSGSLNNKLSVKVTCLNCDELCSELHKAQLELLSYEKVINVLQEEIKNFVYIQTAYLKVIMVKCNSKDLKQRTIEHKLMRIKIRCLRLGMII